MFTNLKKKNIELNEDEKVYKDEYGSFRSKQESEKFGIFVKTFKRFSTKNRKKTSSFNSLGLQLKICLVIYNISQYLNKYDDEFKIYYDEFNIYDWVETDFDFPCQTIIEVETERITEIEENINNMNNDQDIFIQNFLKKKDISPVTPNIGD